MKICPSCQDYSLYDDALDVCPHCGSKLAPYERQTVPDVALPAEKGDGLEQPGLSGVSLSSDSVVHPLESVPVEEQTPPAFVHKEGDSLVFRGTVSEVKSVALDSSLLKKAIRVFANGEPFQIGKMPQQTVIRLEQFHADSLATQKLNVVFYGNIDGYLTVGDDITVYANETHGRYVANRIHSNETESEIPKDQVIPAPAFIIMVTLPLCLLALCLVGAGYVTYMSLTRWRFYALSVALFSLIAAGAVALNALKRAGREIMSAIKSTLILFLLLFLLILFLITR